MTRGKYRNKKQHNLETNLAKDSIMNPPMSKNSQNPPILYGPDNKPIPPPPIMEKLQTTTPNKKKPQQTHKDIKAHKFLISFILGGATLVGAAVFLWPRPSVTEGELADQSNSMSAPFTISNNNFLPLRHVAVFLRICQLNSQPIREFPTPVIPKLSSSDCNLKIGHTPWSNHSLNIDDRFTITPSSVVGLKAEAADIFIEVDYRPWFIPLDCMKCFRFRTHKQPNGYLHWYAVPPD